MASSWGIEIENLTPPRYGRSTAAPRRSSVRSIHVQFSAWCARHR
ncbi:hypothetical protein I553_0711 [Mycobacterium xenopi 4042]|uniref:Uncharacterized protein n=1 Tax=Mycobacterium xenopi 4042 TaxID=1299334 RepID=X7YKM4_MYCXE|nr:hypothetical protein I553_0711 [Mycobacterium xenopi 4042]EUA52584.1 hypothetical protein I552_8692 [Mycobacterium xenopi 3993]